MNAFEGSIRGMARTPAWPRKTREFHNHHFDSTIWNDFRFRDDDIVIATYAKSGTTWMQQMVGQMLFGGGPGAAGRARCRPGWTCACRRRTSSCPWSEAQTHRRFLKTHLPVDALRVLAAGQIHLHRPRRARRGVEHVQPPRQRQRTPGTTALNDTPGLRRAADRAAAAGHPPVLARVAGARRAPVLAVLGKRPQLVGDPRSAQRDAASISPTSSATCPGRCGASRASSTSPVDAARLAGDRGVLLLRLDEGKRGRRARRSAARSGTPVRTASSTRASTGAGPRC